MNWTTDYPTKPGYYWARGVILTCQQSGSPSFSDGDEIVELMPSGSLYFIGGDLPYLRHEIASAEWQGPIEPEEEPSKTESVFLALIKYRPAHIAQTFTKLTVGGLLRILEFQWTEEGFRQMLADLDTKGEIEIISPVRNMSFDYSDEPKEEK